MADLLANATSPPSPPVVNVTGYRAATAPTRRRHVLASAAPPVVDYGTVVDFTVSAPTQQAAASMISIAASPGAGAALVAGLTHGSTAEVLPSQVIFIDVAYAQQPPPLLPPPASFRVPQVPFLDLSTLSSPPLPPSPPVFFFLDHPPPPPLAPPPKISGHNNAVAALAGGCGAAAVVVLSACVVLLCIRVRTGRWLWSPNRQAASGVAFKYDVFLSYRRADFAVAELVCDKFRLGTATASPSASRGPGAGRCLSVFKDSIGAMAGRPFDTSLVDASACLCPRLNLQLFARN